MKPVELPKKKNNNNNSDPSLSALEQQPEQQHPPEFDPSTTTTTTYEFSVDSIPALPPKPLPKPTSATESEQPDQEVDLS
jgi:hypothetical protein